MTMVPALAEAHARHVERMKRMGAHVGNVVPSARVRPVPPNGAPRPVSVPASQPYSVPEGRDWLTIATANSTPVRTKDAIGVVARAYDVTAAAIVGQRRSPDVYIPRAIVCWILRNHSLLSLPQIGVRIGGRDHSSIWHAVRKVDELRRRDVSFADRIDELAALAGAREPKPRDVA